MFHPDHDFGAPSGSSLLTELGPGIVALPGRLEAEEGLERLNGRGFGGVAPARSFATHRQHPDHEEIVMAFGLNRVELIGRLGADVIVNNLASGGRVANLSIATDESYIDRNSGSKVDKTEWHKVVTFQDGLIDMFEKHATRGRLVYVDGKLQTRRWKKPGEETDRFATEILLVPGGRVQFLDKPNGNGARTQPDPDAAGDTGSAPAGGDPMGSDEIPF